MAGGINHWRTATITLVCIQAATTHSCGGQVSRTSGFAVAGTGLLLALHAWRGAGRRDPASTQQRRPTLLVSASGSIRDSRLPPAAIAWMDIATTTDLYEGAPVMVWCWDIPRLPGTMDREGHRAEKGNVALLGIVTQARIQRLPLMAGGKLVDLVVQGNQASEPLLTPSSIAPSMK